MTVRRFALVVAVAFTLVLVVAPEALAAAGGGSSGFGGGYHGGGGRGAGLYVLIQILVRIAIFGHGLGVLIVIGLILLALVFTNVAPRARSFWSERQNAGQADRRRVAQRERRVELAAAEAAEDDPSFAPENVRASAIGLFSEIQAAWDASDRARLRSLVAPELLVEWERRLDDFERKGLHNRVQTLEAPKVEYVGLTHRGSEHGDRVVVRIEAKILDYVEDDYGARSKRVGRVTETVRTREFWTLRKRQGRWILASIEQGAEGAHALGEALVATPWSDEASMRDEALIEGAVAEALPEGTKVAEIADLQFAGDARAAALDLSLADGRFAPDVLEVAARRAVEAWAQAVDGEETGLLAIADPRVIRELLHPGDPTQRTRMVLRGPQVKQLRIASVDAGAEPPTMTIEVEVTARRYIEDRDTAAILSGSRSRPMNFTERWTLALSDDGTQPWRIVAVDAPVSRISS